MIKSTRDMPKMFYICISDYRYIKNWSLCAAFASPVHTQTDFCTKRRKKVKKNKIPSKSSGSNLGSPEGCTGKTSILRHPDQISEPPQWTLFNEEEQLPYLELYGV